MMNVLLNRDSAVKIQSLLPKKLIGAGILKKIIKSAVRDPSARVNNSPPNLKIVSSVWGDKLW